MTRTLSAAAVALLFVGTGSTAHAQAFRTGPEANGRDD